GIRYFHVTGVQTCALPISTIPPVSSVAWTTLITGVNPGKHGIYGFMERKPDSYDIYFTNSTHIKAPTIWDILGEHGKRTIAVNRSEERRVGNEGRPRERAT